MSSYAYLCYLIIPIFFFGPPPEEEWKLRKDEDGIQVYTRDRKGTDFLEYKGLVQLKTDIATLTAVLQDIDNFTNWLPFSDSTRILQNDLPGKLIYYAITDAPWPASDRDGIYSNTFPPTPHGEGPYVIKIDALPDYLPENEDCVRVQEAEGFWKFEALSPDTVKVTYQVLTQPGGSLPAWLVNMSIVKVPFETLTGLRQQVDRPEYRDR